MAAVLVLNTPDDGRLRPKHVEWLCRNKTCTVLHQVGVSFDLAWLGFNRRGRIITRVFRDRNYELQRYWLFPILAEILSILAQNYIFSLKIMLVHFWAVPPGGGHNSRSPPPPPRPFSATSLFSGSRITVQVVLNLTVAEEIYKKPFSALLWQNRPMKSKEIERNLFLLLGIYKPAEGCRFYCMLEYRLQRMSRLGLKE